MTSNGFTLADPNDRGMLDVVVSTRLSGSYHGFCSRITNGSGRKEANKAGEAKTSARSLISKTVSFQSNLTMRLHILGDLHLELERAKFLQPMQMLSAGW